MPLELLPDLLAKKKKLSITNIARNAVLSGAQRLINIKQCADSFKELLAKASSLLSKSGSG